MRQLSKSLTLLVLTATAISSVVFCAPSSGFYQLLSNGYLCISSNFTHPFPGITNKILCAAKCDQNNHCQAFSLADGPCKLFVFDSCSKRVRDCGCFRRGQVFVKQQPGLEPGALCPSGYGDDLCGVKYKLYYGIGIWEPSRQTCESESGLVIMADVTDAAEMDQVDMLYYKYANWSFWLGGFQASGSPEPSGGWYWVACNASIDRNLWGSTQPDDLYGNEDAVGRWRNHAKLSDFRNYSSTPLGVLCECVSPFD